MEEDEEIQTKRTIIMIGTANNQPQLLSVKDEEAAKDSKPELKNSVENQRDDSGVAETNFRASISAETLDSSCDLPCSFEVPVEYALHPFELAKKSQGKLGACKPGSKKGRVGQTAAAQTKNQQGRPDYPLSSELSPTSVTQSGSSIPSPCVTGERVSQGSNRTTTCVPALDRGKSSSSNPLSIAPSHRIPSHDGYNWRKYGQKQIKSPQGSRSYYRCTYSDCYAKKIECSDHTNRVMEIVYRSHHNHDPPQKLSCIRGSKFALVSPVNDSSTHEARPTDDSLPSISSNGLVPETVPGIEFIEPPVPSSSDENTETDVTEECVNETEQQKKLKRSALSYIDSLPKPGKRSKVIVHASGEVYISGDGYRWRKYGQKMVKGNPHPRSLQKAIPSWLSGVCKRKNQGAWQFAPFYCVLLQIRSNGEVYSSGAMNYYRCTSAGCPVRKHIERAKDNTSAFVITYKGKHDHDMPVPKKRDGLTAPVVSDGSSPSTHAPPVMKSEPFQERVSATRSELGEKTVESAKTLLSIGFEVKPC